MPRIKTIAVFCGSKTGDDPRHAEGARALGAGLAQQGITLIYGGGKIGLMGVVADAVLAAGGHVLGVIPEFLTRFEVAHPGVSEMIVTDSMHSRKQLMFERADAFVTMPGGIGTLDETVEIITWRQLGLHDKPILICDQHGWATRLLAALEATIEGGFTDPALRRLFDILPDVQTVLARLADSAPGTGDFSRL